MKLTFVLLFFFSLGLQAQTANREDSLAIATWYQAISSEGKNTNLWDTKQPLAKWSGLELDKEGRIRILRLSGKDLEGAILANFPVLPALALLDMSGNKLTGPLPNLNLPALRMLNLSDNQLSGSLPSFDKMPEVASLALWRNQFTGSLPNFDLPSLRLLNLAYNELSGFIPNFDKLPNLENLNLGDNRFEAQLPSFEHCPKLTKKSF